MKLLPDSNSSRLGDGVMMGETATKMIRLSFLFLDNVVIETLGIENGGVFI